MRMRANGPSPDVRATGAVVRREVPVIISGTGEVPSAWATASPCATTAAGAGRSFDVSGENSTGSMATTVSAVT